MCIWNNKTYRLINIFFKKVKLINTDNETELSFSGVTSACLVNILKRNV